MSPLPHYLAQFRCIAERCEDTCCAGLDVRLAAGEARALEALGVSRASWADPGDGHGPALRKQAGACVLLEPAGLCSVQARFGESALPRACAQFPRMHRSTPGGTCSSGSLACPEIVRAVLWGDDPFAEVPGADEPDAALGWTEQAWATRTWLARVLRDGSAPLATRLLAAVLLGEEREESRWQVALTAARTLRSSVPDRDGVAGLGRALLVAAARGRSVVRLSNFAVRVLGSSEGASNEVLQLSATQGESASENGTLEMPTTGSESASESERVLTRYCEHALSRPDLAWDVGARAVALQLLLRTAVLRCWLRASHAETAAARAFAVEVVQLFAKYVVRDEPFQTAERELLATEDEEALLPRALVLA